MVQPAAEAGARPRPLRAPPAPPGRKIKARLFYVSDDGTRLTGVEREMRVRRGTARAGAGDHRRADRAGDRTAGVGDSARHEAARAVHHRGRRRLRRSQSRGHRGAHRAARSTRLLTIYTLVNALTANLPAITAVQLLVEGKEVDTLSGHVDLRRPLSKNLAWVQIGSRCDPTNVRPTSSATRR